MRSGFKAGNISQHYDFWKQITSDPWVLQTVKGLHIDLLQEPGQLSEPPPFRLSQQKKDLLDVEIAKLVDKGVWKILFLPLGNLFLMFFLCQNLIISTV